MNKKNLSSIILTLLVLVALGVGVVMVKQSQELRRGASFAKADLRLLPADQIAANVGDTFPVHLSYTADPEKVVDAVQATVCYGSQVTIDSVVPNIGLEFEATPIVSAERTIDNKKCKTVVIMSSKPANKLKNTADMGTIYFSGSSVGQGNIEIMLTSSTGTTESMVTGENGTSLDKELAINSATGTSYSITEVEAGPGLVLNVKVAFMGIVKANVCADHMTAGLIVRAVGESKVYSGIQFTRTDQVTAKGFSIYTASKVLSGFTAKTGVAAFFKGMKHLQMKYGVNNQMGFYGKEGGELDLTDSAKVQDLTGYPMLAGDVNQDGQIDANDFSLIKTKTQTYEKVAEGDANSIFDLDGNCQLNTIDIDWLANSLNEKQGELY